MSSRKIKPPKYNIGDIISYDGGNMIDIISGYQWYTGVYKYYLMSNQENVVDESYIDQKIGEANFIDKIK
jgi:hypothetical protein